MRIHSLLHEIVDYAGLFPPAGLGMAEAARNYSEYLASAERWMLGRFVLPAQRLQELAKAVAENPDTSKRWRLSALVPTPASDNQEFQSAVDAIRKFNEQSRHLQVDSLECRLGDLSAANDVVNMTSGLSTFWEVGLDDQLEHQLDWIAERRHSDHFAKVRTGSVDASQIPAAEQVAKFLVGCANRSLAFKATAGLHHPVRGEFPLTYAPDSPCAAMFGFLNVFVGSMLAYVHRWDAGQLTVVLKCDQAEEFTIDGSGVGWGMWMIDWPTVQNLREQFARSFGSCSFREPVEDLEALGILNSNTV